jgi:PqqD family protein of HPr-rel-A system
VVKVKEAVTKRSSTDRSPVPDRTDSSSLGAALARNTRWRISGDTPLIWHHWDDDEYVVFSAASGDTHRINDVTAEVLRQLELSESEFADLARNVARSFGAEVDAQMESNVAKLVVYLDQIGLVEAAP